MPSINSEDINILNAAIRKKFKYAFIYTSEDCMLRYSRPGITIFTEIVESILYDDNFFDNDDYEMTYPGDRDSPPEYSLREDAEACPVINVFKTNNDDCWQLEFAPSEDSLYLFNTKEQFQKILNDVNITEAEVLNGCTDPQNASIFTNSVEVDVEPLEILKELTFISDYDISVDEIQELFN